MINVLELIDGGFLGGGQTHILSIRKNIDTSMYKAIIAASPLGKFKEVADSKGYEFKEIKLPKLFRTKFLNRLDEIVEINNIQIIHSHGGVAGMYARFYKKRFGNVKTVHTLHGIHYINSKNIFRNYISKAFEQYLVPFTDAFICVSDSDKKLALAHKLVKEENTYVIKNGIDVAHFIPLGKSESMLNKLGISKENIVIGNISRFDFQKNQRMILKIAKEIISKSDKVKFLFVGDGKYMKECMFMAKEYGIMENVIFTGEIKEVERYYPLIDLFVFPSLWEGFSITLIEAMSCGKFIIASDIPQNKELIKDGTNGILFNTNDEKDLLAKIMRAIGDEELRSELAMQALKDSRNFKEDNMTREIEKIYSNLSNLS